MLPHPPVILISLLSLRVRNFKGAVSPRGSPNPTFNFENLKLKFTNFREFCNLKFGAACVVAGGLQQVVAQSTAKEKEGRWYMLLWSRLPLPPKMIALLYVISFKNYKWKCNLLNNL